MDAPKVKSGNGRGCVLEPISDELMDALARVSDDVKLLRSAQDATDAWIRRQDEITGRMLAEIGLARKAAEKASDAAVMAITKLGQIESSWTSQQERIVGRVAQLETEVSRTTNQPAQEERVNVQYDLDLLSENTQTRLVTADREAIFAAFIREREATVKLREELAALQARFDERDAQATRLRMDARQAMSFRLAWWKLLIGAIVAVATGVGAAIGAMYHGTP